LIADPLSIELSQAGSFAQFVLEKTSGNPFFVNELLTYFYADRLIYFDYKRLKAIATLVELTKIDSL